MTATTATKQFKFRAFGYPAIERVEIERETEASVWVRGRQCRKRSDYHCYYDTAKEAAEAIIAKYRERLMEAHREMESATKDLESAKKQLERYESALAPILSGVATAPDEIRVPENIEI